MNITELAAIAKQVFLFTLYIMGAMLALRIVFTLFSREPSEADKVLDSLAAISTKPMVAGENLQAGALVRVGDDGKVYLAARVSVDPSSTS